MYAHVCTCIQRWVAGPDQKKIMSPLSRMKYFWSVKIHPYERECYMPE